jgi:hypothetical protein
MFISMIILLVKWYGKSILDVSIKFQDMQIIRYVMKFLKLIIFINVVKSIYIYWVCLSFDQILNIGLFIRTGFPIIINTPVQI